jgi:hypothetical protein
MSTKYGRVPIRDGEVALEDPSICLEGSAHSRRRGLLTQLIE